MHSETQKIRDRVMKYVGDTVIDVGCGPDKIVPSAIGIDGRDLPGVDLVADITRLHEALKEGGHPALFDTVFSSHVLEHMPDDMAALKSWAACVRTGGYLVLYLPDDRFYDNKSNPEHFWYYTYCDFLSMFMSSIEGFQVVESGPHIGPDKYSFYLVAQKL